MGHINKIILGTLDLTLNEIKNIFKLRYENKDDPPIDDVIFKLGINDNCPQINCNVFDWNRQVGKLLIKKNVISKLDFKHITVKVLNEKAKFKIQIGSKMGLRGWNSIKNILKYNEFQFFIDFSAHKDFDRIRLSDDGIKEFMYGVQNCTSLKYLNIQENNISQIGAEILKEYMPRTSIEQLNISHNPLGNVGIQYISKLINLKNFDLKYLNVSSCKFNQLGALHLYKRLKGSQTL